MSLPPYILVENSVHNSADRVINWASLHEILVVSCAVGNVEIVTSASIPFGIDSVQCKRNNRVNICGEGRFRPGGIYFATRALELGVPRCTVIGSGITTWRRMRGSI